LTAVTPARPEPHALERLALDLGPVAIFFAVNAASHNVFAATATFMGVTLIAMIVSQLRFGRISPMQWFSSAMVLVLGGLTIWLHQDWIIKVKPTIYYLLVSAILWFGLWTGKPTLKLALGNAYPGLDERGWVLLSRNWAIFFVAMAIANEAVWRNFSTNVWAGYKLWGAIPATMIFAVANMPMLLKHGLGAETSAEALVDAPPSE
jgi:intracellular septation protein